MTFIATSALTFQLLDGETLLEGLERTGHEVNYQCRSGFCGACRLPLLRGSVSYPVQPIAFVASNEVLPCCCRVLESVAVECGLHELQSVTS